MWSDARSNCDPVELFNPSVMTFTLSDTNGMESFFVQIYLYDPIIRDALIPKLVLGRYRSDVLVSSVK